MGLGVWGFGVACIRRTNISIILTYISAFCIIRPSLKEC